MKTERYFAKIDIDPKNELAKVVGFPGHESMWVEVLEGDGNSGSGILRNYPEMWDLECGDVIRFDGGTDELKPQYKWAYPIPAKTS